MADLYPEDQARVDAYLAQSIHQVPRAPFSPMRLLAVLVAVLAVLSAIAWLVASRHGVV